MRISGTPFIKGTFLKSKVAQRIAMILFLATVIPMLLTAGLSHKKINELIEHHEHQKLVEESNYYALSVFKNLVFARSVLEQLDTAQNKNALKDLLTIRPDSYFIFNAISQLNQRGEVLSKTSHSHIVNYSDQVKEKYLIQNKKYKTSLAVFPKKLANASPTIAFVTQTKNSKNLNTWLIAEINPDFLWGQKSDFALDKNICVYQLDGDIKNRLFCALDTVEETDTVNKRYANTGSWNLFLKGEFNHQDWQFSVSKVNPTITSPFAENKLESSFLGAVVLSLLLAGLLGLIQIRRIMVPLEKLVDATRRASEGEFSQVHVSGQSEFSELSGAFNNMSNNIKQKMDTLQSLSAIDREIVANLDVNQLIEQVIKRILTLQPEATVSVFQIGEKTEHEAQCKLSIGQQDVFSSKRVSVPMTEIEALRTYRRGIIIQQTSNKECVYPQIMQASDKQGCWLLPILWQGEIQAFISIASDRAINNNNDHLQEYRDLAKRIAIAISAQAREKKLMTQAQYDMLTGLPNRILLDDRLNNAIAHTDRTGNPFWVIFIDIDRFKYVNDTFGHGAGDDLLRSVANRLKDCVRDSDTVSRFGGDEFIIILEQNNSHQENLTIMTRIMESIALPIQTDALETVITCSAGIAVYPKQNANAETLIKHADIAMYRAKEMGKNNFQFFEDSMNAIATERLKIERLLRSAIENNELSIHYQPKLDIKSNKIVGLESLLRWNNHELGKVSPARFIPIAEETGLINNIGTWVLEQACKQAMLWQQAGMQPLLVSVNVSTKQLQQENFITQVQDILKATKLQPENLELEITESLFMKDQDRAKEVLNRIKELGIKLSVDDFGTGFSNLSYLDDLPLDTLKIDKSFIDNIKSVQDKVVIVDTIISLAKNLDLKIVAEGVETVEQLNYLTARNCDEIQGYYISKPVNVSNTEKLLKSYRHPKVVAIPA